ncbi:MAG: hypothetical protein EP315_07840 [Gammaproteobacteria bacterium]|nr:MAG: hypothetical protein EP315_07840 [Gammaproteobacteria bacterium]
MIDKILLVKLAVLSVSGALGISYVAKQPGLSEMPYRNDGRARSIGDSLNRNLDAYARQETELPDTGLLGGKGRYEEVYIGKR